MRPSLLLVILFLSAESYRAVLEAAQPNETPERKLPLQFNPEFEAIAPYLSGTQMTPRNAFDRVLAITKRLEGMEKSLYKQLRTIKEYIKYHRLSPRQRKMTIPSWNSMASLDPSEIMSQNPSSSVDFSMTDLGLSSSGDRELFDLYSQPSVNKLSNTPVDHPLLHNYGQIDAEEHNFSQLRNPSEEPAVIHNTPLVEAARRNLA